MVKRMQVVDLVRTFSILAVLAVHLAGPQTLTQPCAAYWQNLIWYKFWVAGSFGVPMFFVISGFLITRLIDSNPNGLFDPDFRDFYSRRFGRIVPLLAFTGFWGMVMVRFFPASSSIFQTCFRNPLPSDFGPFFGLSIATFSFNWYKIFTEPSGYASGLHWDVLWSLSIEEQFYFFYPLVLKILRTKQNLVFILTLLVIAGPLSILWFGQLFPHIQVIHNSFAGFNLIAMGSLLYLTSNHYQEVLIRKKYLCVFLCFFGFVVFLLAYTHQDYKADVWGHFFNPSLIGLGVFFFLLGGLQLDLFESKFLTPLAFPGKLSYGMYLLHISVLYFLCPFLTGKNQFLAFFVLATVTIGIAYLSFRYYEMPANLFFRRILGRTPKKGA